MTCCDAWERPPEGPPRDWLGRARGAPGDPPSLPWPSSYIALSGGADGTLRTWGIKWRLAESGRGSGEAVAIASHAGLHKGPVEAVRLSLDGRLAASAGRDGRLGVVDVPTSKSWLMALPAGVGGGRRWGGAPAADASEGAPPAAPTGLPLTCLAIDVLRRPVTITTGGLDGTCRVWDLRSGGCAVAFPAGSPVWAFGHVGARGAGAAQLDAQGSLLAGPAPIGDQFLASGHEDGAVRLWDSRRPDAPMTALLGHAAAVTALAADGSDKLLTGAADGSVRLWDAHTGVSVSCEGAGAPVSSVALSQDYMIAASWDGALRTFFPAT